MSLDMLMGWILIFSHIVVTDSVIIENFEIFFIQKATFIFLFQYHNKFQSHCKYASKLKKTTTIEKVNVSWMSIFHGYMLFLESVFQMLSMKRKARTKAQVQESFWPCSLLELNGQGRREISSNLFVQILYNYFSKYIALFQYLITPKDFCKVHVPMSFSLAWLTFFTLFYACYLLQELLLSLGRDITKWTYKYKHHHKITV